MTDSLDCALPDFDNPPVVETVLSVQFERLPAMRSVHFWLFWQRVRDQFPNTEERPTLASIVEQATPPPVELRCSALSKASGDVSCTVPDPRASEGMDRSASCGRATGHQEV